MRSRMNGMVGDELGDGAVVVLSRMTDIGLLQIALGRCRQCAGAQKAQKIGVEARRW